VFNTLSQAEEFVTERLQMLTEYSAVKVKCKHFLQQGLLTSDRTSKKLKYTHYR